MADEAARDPSRSPVPEAVLAFYRRARPLAVARLREALNPATGLFDRQLRDKRWDETLGTEDLTSTAICLIGLHRAAVSPGEVGLDLPRVLAALCDVTRRREYLGGLGLVIWANAVQGAEGYALSELCRRAGIDLSSVAARLARLTTMETAWLVSGLAHEHVRAPVADTKALLSAALRELSDRQHPTSRLFCHASETAPLAHRARRWVANFADQIYSVQALALAGAAGFGPELRLAGSACAAKLIALQGSLGQWWWHYDPRAGGVAQPFPVYSVHQHAMAPMALLTLTRTGGPAAADRGDYGDAIALSVRWVHENEMGVDLYDEAAGTIWRDVEPDEGGVARRLRQVRSLVGWPTSPRPSGPGGPDRGAGGAFPPDRTRLKINFETRPYEWAWCLFAGSLSTGTARDGHIA